MIIIPKDMPVLENLNIYYLNVKKLLEHYQGEVGCGGVHFKSHAAEGVIFFDKDDLLNGSYRDKAHEISGPDAIERLLSIGDEHNFVVNIYRIDPQEIYYWASIPTAERIYKDLSTEFTDLQGLIKKMSAEKLTGYIDVQIGAGDEVGLIFIINGKIIGGFYSWGNGKPNPSKENQQLLVQKTKEKGGIFNVCRIPLNKMQSDENAVETIPIRRKSTIEMLEELLGTLETVVASRKKIKSDFGKLLKQKFVEKADKYAFLDPFAGEFEYHDGKIDYSGEADAGQLAEAVADSVKEIASENGLLPELIDHLAEWSHDYAGELQKYQIDIASD
jgi:hypothetical protein